jgi:hypothetical protein
MLDMIRYKKYPLQKFKANYHVHRRLPEIPVMNQTHPNQNSLFILLIQIFLLSSNQYKAAQLEKGKDI